MTLNLHAKLTADASQGKATVKEMAGEVDALGTSLEGTSQVGGKATAQIINFEERLSTTGRKLVGTTGAADKLNAELVHIGRDGKRAAGGLVDLGGAAAQASNHLGQVAQDSQRVDQTQTLAAGSVANLTAQFNDIGIMLMAGQNPLLLAVQQGTQISQVIGPMGTTGAVRGLSAALVSMVSPINLITIGSIAAGAAITQWLTGAGEGAKDFEDHLGALDAALKSYEASSELAEASTAELEERFGSTAEAMREFFDQIADADLRNVRFGIKGTIDQLIEETDLNLPDYGFGDQVHVARMYDVSLFGADASARRERQQIVNETLEAYRALEAAAEGSVEEQIKAAKALRDALKAGSELTGGITKEENDRLVEVDQLLLKLGEVQGKMPNPIAQARQSIAAWAEEARARIEGIQQVRTAQIRFNQLVTRGAIELKRAGEQAQDKSAIEDMIASLEQENALRRTALRYGEDSLEYASAQADAERATLEEKIAGLDVSEDLKDELRVALETSLELSGVDLAGGIGAGADEALRLAENLGISLSLAQRIASFGPQGIGGPGTDDPNTGFQYGGRGGDPRAFGGAAFDWQTRDAANWEPPKKKRGGSRSKQSEAQKQQKRIKDLIKGYQQELDLLREMDPVQKELIRNREVLAGASKEQKTQITELITTLESERIEMDRVSELTDFIGASMMDLLPALARDGDDAASAWRGVADALEQAAWQALILGEGPLGGFMPGGGLTGWISDVVSSAFGIGAPQAKADGGMIHGQGGSRDDRVPVWMSPGEFAVNADATAKHRALLEAINSGAPLPGFANGGAISGASAPGGTVIQLFDQSRGVKIEQDGPAVLQSDGSRLQRFILSDAVSEALDAQGGQAARTMRQLYGLQRRGSRR
ncbi:MAG: phage tail length tape measure family protein [Pelagimonas sp.]|jgi:hypothetical protein|nr:phage tail length tape measure family protein [Pelagimonas sp.]